MPTGYLTTTSMLDPWESLKVNERRQFLAADNGQNGGGGPEIDIYDVSGDCRFPQLLASSPSARRMAAPASPAPVIGHEGSWAPDGLTYYGGDLRNSGGQYYAVDTTDPTAPKLITRWTPGIAPTCTACRSATTAIAAISSRWEAWAAEPARLTDPNVAANNGLLIYDLSEIQARKPNPQVRLISKLFWKDGVGRAAHDSGQDQGQALRHLRRRRRLRRHRAAPRSCRPLRCRTDAVPDGADHRHQRREETRRSFRS